MKKPECEYLGLVNLKLTSSFVRSFLGHIRNEME